MAQILYYKIYFQKTLPIPNIGTCWVKWEILGWGDIRAKSLYFQVTSIRLDVLNQMVCDNSIEIAKENKKNNLN